MYYYHEQIRTDMNFWWGCTVHQERKRERFCSWTRDQMHMHVVRSIYLSIDRSMVMSSRALQDSSILWSRPRQVNHGCLAQGERFESTWDTFFLYVFYFDSYQHTNLFFLEEKRWYHITSYHHVAWTYLFVDRHRHRQQTTTTTTLVLVVFQNGSILAANIGIGLLQLILSSSIYHP